MLFTDGLKSSLTDEWATPPDLFKKLNSEFNFTLDVCATDDNHKCDRYYTKEDNGLAQEWAGVCWMNPPYGREIGKWVKKAADSAHNGVVVVALVPARTDTKWWHDQAMRASEIRLVYGRLKFGGSLSTAPFPSAILIFGTRRDPIFKMMNRPDQGRE